MKKTLAAAAVTASLMALGAGAASAAETYPAPAPPSAVSKGTVQAGSAVTFSGTGFTPGEQITITAEARVAGIGAGAGSRSIGLRVPMAPLQLATQADTTGAFTVEVMLSEPGVYTLTATGATSGVTRTNVVTVTAAAAQATAPEGGLAETGSDGLLLWGAAGTGALAAGAAATLLARRGTKPAVI